MTKLFVTGGTGYIGGDALQAIANAHPDYEITCLVRNSDKGAAIAQHFPKIKFVYGELKDVGVIEEETKKADIVCNFANADHEDAIDAILRGLSLQSKEHPGFLIHTSGTGILLGDDIARGVFGESSDKIFDDLEGLHAVRALPESYPHRVVDEKIFRAAKADGLNTAIVCPPTIYGAGRGPGNQRSHQVPELARSTLERKKGLRVGAGKTYWGNVHVYDLSALYLLLVENAAAGGSKAEWADKPKIFGEEGFYFVENGEHQWGDVSNWVAAAAYKQKLIETDEVDAVDAEEAGKLTPKGGALWGANSRARAKRARVALNWRPVGESLEQCVPVTVEFEAKKLGLKPGHAKVAAGDA